MIRDDADYKESAARLDSERRRLDSHRMRLREAGLTDEECKRVTDPIESFHLQHVEEIAYNERLRGRRSSREDTEL